MYGVEELMRLKSFLYDLARDCVPIGEINRILIENTKIQGGIIYSDSILALWAERAAEELLKGMRYADPK